MSPAYPTSAPPGLLPSRRSVLKAAATGTIAAGGLVGIAACSGPAQSGAAVVPSSVSLDERVRRSAAAAETAFAVRASALSRSWSARRAPAAAIDLAAAEAAAHAVHAGALLHGLPQQAKAGTASAGSTATAPPAATIGSPAVPATATALAHALDVAAAGYLRELVPLAPASATLLASIAASDSAFAALLRATGR